MKARRFPSRRQRLLMISTQGTLPPGAQIGGIDITISLPQKVTVKASPDVGNPTIAVTDAGVVVASGVAASDSYVLATYASATGSTAPNVLLIHVANAAGFGTGEFITVHADITAGTLAKAADFSLSGLDPRDLSGAPISGLTAGFTADIK